MTVINSNIITEVANMGAGGTALAEALNNINDTFTAMGVGSTSDIDVVYDSVAASSFKTDKTGADAVPYAELSETAGASTIGVYADANNNLGIVGFKSTGAIAIASTSETGNFQLTLTDNLADAWSIKISSGNDLMVFRTTNSDETVFICPAAGQEVSFFGAAGSAQLSHLADPAADAAALATAFATLIDGLKALGLMAPDP